MERAKGGLTMATGAITERRGATCVAEFLTEHGDALAVTGIRLGRSLPTGADE
jgi:hypothetical protein